MTDKVILLLKINELSDSRYLLSVIIIGSLVADCSVSNVVVFFVCCSSLSFNVLVSRCRVSVVEHRLLGVGVVFR